MFHPDFKRYCIKKAAVICAANKHDPWLIGYFLDNELEWHSWTGGGLFADTFSKDENDPAKQALVQLFEQTFITTQEFNKHWSPRISSFADIKKMRTPLTPRTEKARAAITAYVRLAAERYFYITTQAIRTYDPNHLILGCRFAGQAPDIWDIAGRYCDAISVNCYRTIDLDTGQFSDGFENELRNWYAQTKKPLIITEWSFPALDTGLPCRHGAGQRVATQKEKAFAFIVFQKYIFSCPFIIGSNYFMWADQPALGISKIFPEDSNYGLVNEHDEPYALLTEAASKLHPLVYEIHQGK